MVIKMISITDMINDEYKQKAYVHYQSWIETYTGLIDAEFLRLESLEYCECIALKFPHNTIVAKYNGHIVGFAAYEALRDNNSSAGKVMTMYVLRSY